MINSNLKNKKRFTYILKIILALFMGILILFPIYMMLASSLKPKTEVFDMKLIPDTFTTEGYALSIEENFGHYFLNSLYVTLTVTVVALIFHAMSGYALARLNFAGKNGVFMWILSTLMIPFSVIIIPLFILVKDFGWLDSFKGIIIPAILHISVTFGH